MDVEYYMKIQNAYGTKSKREKDLAKVNRNMKKHFDDTFDTETVFVNGQARELMIIKDTDNNTFKKKIKSIHEEPFNLGDYVEWNGQMWLITLVDVDDKTWNRGYMYLCTVPLRWQNSKGDIIERWAYSEDFTKYSSGVSSNNTITVGDNQYGLTLPIDEETKLLNRDMRFAIDFDESAKPDIYKLTNRKVMLNNNAYFGRGGTMITTLSFDALNDSADKRVAMPDGKEVWICDYISPTTPPENDDETTILSGTITGTISGNKNLKVGFERTYTANLVDDDGNTVEWSNGFNWNIPDGIEVTSTVNGGEIELLIEDEDLIDTSFALQILDNKDGSVITEITITVVGMF